MLAQRTYEQIYYLESGFFNPVNDGVRGKNVHYSKMVDLTMSHYTERMSSGHLTMISVPGLDDRVKMIRDHVALQNNNYKGN